LKIYEHQLFEKIAVENILLNLFMLLQTSKTCGKND